MGKFGRGSNKVVLSKLYPCVESPKTYSDHTPRVSTCCRGVGCNGSMMSHLLLVAKKSI